MATNSLSGFQVKENNYRGHGDSVDQLCWHPTNPDLFVTASGDKTIRIWDVRTTKCIATVNTKGLILLWCVNIRLVFVCCDSTVHFQVRTSTFAGAPTVRPSRSVTKTMWWPSSMPKHIAPRLRSISSLRWTRFPGTTTTTCSSSPTVAATSIF